MRFAGVVALAFVTTFALVAWIARGMPTTISSLTAPGSTVPNSTVPNLPQKAATKPGPEIRSFAQEQQSLGENRGFQLEEKTSQSDRDPKRDKLRLDLLQAANAAELSPCNATIKANLVAALTAYVTAYNEKLNCTHLLFCSDKKIEAAAQAFRTPLDERVREQVAKASAWGAIKPSDLPSSVRYYASSMMSSDDSPTPICSIPARLREEAEERKRRR